MTRRPRRSPRAGLHRGASPRCRGAARDARGPGPQASSQPTRADRADRLRLEQGRNGEQPCGERERRQPIRILVPFMNGLSTPRRLRSGGGGSSSADPT